LNEVELLSNTTEVFVLKSVLCWSRYMFCPTCGRLQAVCLQRCICSV